MKQLSRLGMMSRRRAFKTAYFACGHNAYGQLAINNSSIFPNVLTAPVTPYTGVNQPDSWSAFSMRNNSVAAVKSDGTLWTAGDNTFGQLGLGDTTHRNRFTQVLCETSSGSGVIKTDWRDVGVGTEHIAALDAQGNIWCAGRNDIAAAVGNGSKSPSNVLNFYNTALTAAPFRVSPIVFKAIKVGHRFTMGLDVNNDIWTWGNNGSRQLGRASPAGVENPTQDTYHRKIDQPGPWLKMFAGGYHAAALHSNGEMYSWGLYSSGQRGAGVSSQTPAIIPKIDGVPWVDAYMGENTTFLRNANGVLYACGTNGSGELGLGTTTTTTTPTALPGVWRMVAIDWYHAVGVRSDGTLWSWGSNQSGQLGLGGGGSVSVPTQIGTATDWNGAVVGIYASMAYKSVEVTA